MGKLDHGTMCIMCQTLPLSKPRTSSHPNMTPLTPKKDFGEFGVQRLYRCSICNTHWLYQQDKWQVCLGFKLWPGSLSAYLAQEASYASQNQTPPIERTNRGQARWS